jgi:hypothetical protein
MKTREKNRIKALSVRRVLTTIVGFALIGAAGLPGTDARADDDPAPPAPSESGTIIATKTYVDSLATKRAKPSDIATAVSALIPISQKGAADGVATLDADGKVPNAQLQEMPNGADYLRRSGGTMTGMMILAGAPITALQPATKGYVDSLAAKSAGGLTGKSPGWTIMNAANWESPHWGDTWEAVSANNLIKVEGVAACLSTTAATAPPNASTVGPSCWCRVSRVNDESVLGAWVFYSTYTTNADCNSNCAIRCGYCVRNGTNNSCSRSALCAAP